MSNNFKLSSRPILLNFSTTSTLSSVQHIAYHNESQPMTTHQRAALAQAALVNFFGESGTVTSILNRVQPSHTQTLSDILDEQDLDISQQGRSIPVSTQTYTIPHISQSTQPTTHTATQQIQTDKATKYHIIIQIHILLLIIEERDDIGCMIITIKGNIHEKMIENKTS